MKLQLIPSLLVIGSLLMAGNVMAEDGGLRFTEKTLAKVAEIKTKKKSAETRQVAPLQVQVIENASK
ncbi:hypothetical protein G5T41_13150 [Acinetobacter sp. GFQ9D192M]|uniref:hypothetical protein n=1 Tax=unclassified Acinetobacter TaxID=196816 RepID=UPI001408D777|nr:MULTISPECIES: hypothetical protein [unclassified Acinetobacter]NHB65644.1 hypothetical protein [Acinetobacter sp. GFQ9D191M]NHC01427.1 hypothetical protein [Acinetobacter sp. GFQ9D192M]